jgi:hypothetical protein
VCDAVKYKLPYAIFDWIMLTGMLVTGSFIMYEGISNVFSWLIYIYKKIIIF